jgi:hypothetical protein
MSKFSKSAAALPPPVSKNPPVSFVSKVKKMDKIDGPETDKSEWSWSFSWIQTIQPTSTSYSLLSSRMDASSRGLDQVGDGLP